MADRIKCKAHSQGGKPCGNNPIPGGTVCRFHGGGAPQVIEAAKMRILELVDPALHAAAQQLKEEEDPRVRSQAWRDILDRAGLAATKEVAVSGGVEVTIAGVDMEDMK